MSSNSFLEWAKSGASEIKKLYFLIVSRIFVVVLASIASMFGLNVNFPNPPVVELPVIGNLAKWDSGYYYTIAEHGYSPINTPIFGVSQWAYRPIFPVFMNSFSYLFRWVGSANGSEVAGGFLLNLVATIILGIYLVKLTERFLGSATRMVVLFSVYPATLFLTAIYPEATMLMFVVACIYYLESGRPLLAGALGFLAGLTTPEAFLIFIPFLVKSVTSKSSRTKLVLGSAISFSSLPLFIAFSWIRTGSALLPYNVESNWPKNTILDLLKHPPLALNGTNVAFDFNLLIMGYALVFMVLPLFHRDLLKKIYPYVIWSFTLSVVYLTGDVASFGRFSMTLLPAFWAQVYYCEKHPGLFAGLVAFNAIALALGIMLFVNWYPFH